jgi:hypothetical protein
MKGQYFSFDAIIGAVIFIMAIGLLLNYWYGVRAVAQSQERHLGTEALAMSDTLLSDGLPFNWYNNILTAKTPGLLTGNVLNKTKILRFRDHSAATAPANYTRLKELFGLSGEYYVTIQPYKPDGDPDAEWYGIGNETPNDAVEVGHVTRAGIYQGMLAKIDIYVWSLKLGG